MHVAFRVDAAPEIGSGHLQRCRTLAAAVERRGCRTSFVMRRHARNMNAAASPFRLYELPAPLAPINAADHRDWLGVPEIEDAEATLAALESDPADVVVVDHYSIGAVWEDQVRSRVGRLLAIDDLADREHRCDLLLDTTPREAADTYDRLVSADTERLLGLRYALLRPEFAAARANGVRRNGRLERVLIAFGGADNEDYTGATLHALAADAPDLAVDVVLGSAAPHLDAVRAAAAQRANVALHVDTPAMASLMLGADLAIGAGGTTSWERLCIGLPTLVVEIAPNQREVVQSLARLGGAVELRPGEDYVHHLGDALRFLRTQPNFMQAMAKRGMAAVDGRGADRVAARLTMPPIILRSAAIEDMRDVWTWRNDPLVRAASRSSEPVPWPSHEAWYRAALAAPMRHLLIAEAGNEAVAVLRFDVDGPEAEVSIYATPAGLGRGFGPGVLLAGEAWLRREVAEVAVVRAVILEDNAASIAAFKAAGYEADHRVFYRKIM